jgi:hypothetical protein
MPTYPIAQQNNTYTPGKKRAIGECEGVIYGGRFCIYRWARGRMDIWQIGIPVW